MEMESMPCTAEFMIPHSRPAWMLVMTGFFFVYALYREATFFVSGEDGSGAHDGYASV